MCVCVAEAISLHFLKHDSLCVRRATEGVRLPSGAQMRLLVVVVAPPLLLAVILVLSGRPQTTWFACERKQQNKYHVSCYRGIFI